MIRAFQHDIAQGYPELEPLDAILVDPPYGTGRVFEDYPDDMPGAKRVIKAIVEGAPRALSPGGVLGIILDHRLSWYARALCEINPELSFLNEIVWAFNSGGAGGSRVPQKHATITVFHRKGANPTFNVIREPYPNNYGNRPGFHPEGRMITSVWNIPILSTTSSQRTGYSTEKPPLLLRRWLEVYTQPNALVYDPCCGSGSAATAAISCGRQFVGSDINPKAIEVTLARGTA